MTEELKQIIDNANYTEHGVYSDFLFISMNEAYNGLWAAYGANGFNNMIVLAGDLAKNEWVRLSLNQCDSFNIMGLSYLGVIDVPTHLDCIRVHFKKPLQILISASSIMSRTVDINFMGE